MAQMLHNMNALFQQISPFNGHNATRNSTRTRVQCLSTFNEEDSIHDKNGLQSLENTARIHQWPVEFTFETREVQVPGAAL